MIDKAIFALPGVGRILGLLVASAALQALAVLGQAWSLSTAITNLWLGGAVVDQALLVAVFLVCFIGRQGVLCAQSALLDAYAYEQANALRRSLLEKIFTTNARLVQDHGTGSVTAAVLEGADQVETYFKLILPKVTGIALIPAILLAASFALDWVSGLIMFVAFPFIILYMVIMGHTAKEKASRQHRTFEIMSNHFIDTLRGIDTLKLFGVSKRYGKSIYEVSERFREATMRTLKVANLSSLVLDTFATLSVAAVAFMLGFRLIDGSVTLFPALALLVIAPEYFRPIREFAADYHASLDGKNALASIQALVDAPDEPPAELPLPAWHADARLGLEGVGFSYLGFKALEGVTLAAEGFQKVGIVGASGSGKSTLASLIRGDLAPASGSVTLNGVPTSSFGDGVARCIGVIQQQTYLFNMTLRENLRIGNPAATDDEIREVLAHVGLSNLVERARHHGGRGRDALLGRRAPPHRARPRALAGHARHTAGRAHRGPRPRH